MLHRGILILLSAGLTLSAMFCHVLWSEDSLLGPAALPWLFGLIVLIQVFIFGLVVRYLREDSRRVHRRTVAAGEEELTQFRLEMERELEAESARIDQQSRKLADRYRVMHEWMDYPRMLDLQSGDALPVPSAAQASVFSLQHRSATAEDRKVREILDSQAETIYEKIRQNTYSPHGQFDPLLLRDDMLEVVVRIARVYQPQLQNPLLSTSPEQIARALNRIGLHLLVVMDQLPLDLKSYNIQRTYDTIRHAITTYGTYKRASPYLNWASKGMYVGRMVTSTNPIALGLLWGATELGKFGAQKLATHLIDRQAIGFLQSVIRVVGYEVAAIYGGDFRYRDPNWCYAVELTHMMGSFPHSRESIQYAFRELGRLQLRNEYDRLAAYRALAAGKVLDRKQTHPEQLDETERKQIIELLEKAYAEILHGRYQPEADRWRKGVQDHLGMQMTFQSTVARTSQPAAPEGNIAIFEYLVGFLRVAKQTPSAALQSAIESLKLPSAAGAEQAEHAQQMIDNLLKQPAGDRHIEFIPPDLDPNSKQVNRFLEAMCRINAEQPPYSPQAEQILLETGLYYRRPVSEWTGQILDCYQQQIAPLVPHVEKLEREPYRLLCRGLLYLANELEIDVASIQQVHRHVSVAFTLKTPTAESPNPIENYFVVVLPDRAILLHCGNLESYPEIVWSSDETTQLENTSSMLTAEARLSGGQTVGEWKTTPVLEIKLQAPMTARYQNYFAALSELFGESASPAS